MPKNDIQEPPPSGINIPLSTWRRDINCPSLLWRTAGSKSGVFTLGTAPPCVLDNSLLWMPVLCIAGCLVASCFSPPDSDAPFLLLFPPRDCDKQKHLQPLLSEGLGAKSLLVENHWCRGFQCFVLSLSIKRPCLPLWRLRWYLPHLEPTTDTCRQG